MSNQNCSYGTSCLITDSTHIKNHHSMGCRYLDCSSCNASHEYVLIGSQWYNYVCNTYYKPDLNSISVQQNLLGIPMKHDTRPYKPYRPSSP